MVALSERIGQTNMSTDKTDVENISWPRFRAATNADREQIRDLVFGVLTEYGLKPDPDGIDTDLKDIEQSYFSRGGKFSVLEDADGRIIATCALYAMDKATCELRKMYIRPEHRGRGYGKQLLEAALSQARRMGFETMTLETATVLKEAVCLYKSYGFKPYESAHLCWRCDQAYTLEL